jgi:hypothetical protein
MRRLTLFLVLIFSLALAADAAAKEVVAAKVCGPSDCVETHNRDQLALFTDGGAPTDPPSRGGAWYSVRVTVEVDRGQHENFRMVVLPRAGLMRAGDESEGYTWYHLTPSSAKRYQALVANIDAYPPSKLEGVGPPKVRVDEVVLPPREPEAAADGGSSPLPWIGGALALLIAAGLVLVLRRRGLPWVRPSEG